MWKKKSIITFTLFAALFLWWPCVGGCSEAAPEPETLTVLKTDWIMLQQNNAAQKKALEKSQAELNAVKKARDESDRALIEAKILLETSQMTSDEMTQLCATLLNELSLSKAENERLTKELRDAKSESLTAYEAIVKANQYLQDTKNEIEANEAAWRKRENQLKRQRLLWQVFSALCAWGGYAIAK